MTDTGMRFIAWSLLAYFTLQVLTGSTLLAMAALNGFGPGIEDARTVANVAYHVAVYSAAAAWIGVGLLISKKERGE